MGSEEAKQEIQRLVARYDRLDARAVKRYNEANTKDGFVRPLFEALGWDFSNLDEVEGEKTITPGRVDYLFKVDGVAKFCLEVKALHVDINDERWIKQAIGYAYFKGVTWAVLTNFKALRVFNAERETKDLTQIAFLNLTCESYVTDFHRLWLLSREAVASGDLDKEAVAYGRLPPRLAVEKRLYEQLKGWRETLFNEVYLYYKDQGVTWSEVDLLVQQLLDRLIFIRTAEDRGLIDRKLLAALHQWEGSDKKTRLMDRLRDIFHEFASLYDSDLFPQIMDPWDRFSVYDSRALADIIQGLYEVPGGLADWNFATIGYDVLGTVYEQYLGYVPTRVKEEIREAQQRLFPTEPHIGLTAKREKRKGEGIYYTPPWVVDYIVKQTVGRFIEEHSYNDILNMAILDPACGSGSFLTRAYEELLNYHARQQGKSPAELEQWERTRILLRNIYGVDLDQQAVEIARLSLLLCSLSGQETLPSLADNICRGNSLISGTEEELRGYFGDKWEEKHRFNWHEEFRDIMKDGGFDIVIGNPPYGSKKMLTAEEKAFIKEHTRCTGSNDIAEFFISRTAELLVDGGYHGFIVPKPVTYITSWQQIREFLAAQSIESLVDVSTAFEEVLLEQVILIFRKQPPTGLTVPVAALVGGQIEDLGTVGRQFFDKRILAIYLTSEVEGLVRKLWRESKQLSDVARIFAGIGGVTPYLTLDKSVKGRECIRGGNIERFGCSDRPIFLLPEGYFTQRDLDEHALRRIICQDIVAHITRPQPHIKITATLDITKRLTHETVINIALKPGQESVVSLQYLLGLLNSKLISWYVYRFIFNCAIRTMHFRPGYADYVPIRCIDFENPEQKEMHDNLVALVERMLELNKRLAPIRNTPCNERDELMREIQHIDRQIDNLVYDLYGLTEEERKIVEESI